MARPFKTQPLWWRHANRHREGIQEVFDLWKNIKEGDVISPSWNPKLKITVTEYRTDGESLYLFYTIEHCNAQIHIKLDENTYPKTIHEPK